MALTHTDLLRTVMGNKRVVITETTFDASYPTGGESLAAADVGLSTIDSVIPLGIGGYVFEWDRTNSKLKARQATAAHTHTENTAVAYTQNAATAASAAAVAGEVANATDLSAAKAHLLIIGF